MPGWHHLSQLTSLWHNFKDHGHFPSTAPIEPLHHTSKAPCEKGACSDLWNREPKVYSSVCFRIACFAQVTSTKESYALGPVYLPLDPCTCATRERSCQTQLVCPTPQSSDRARQQSSTIVGMSYYQVHAFLLIPGCDSPVAFQKETSVCDCDKKIKDPCKVLVYSRPPGDSNVHCIWPCIVPRVKIKPEVKQVKMISKLQKVSAWINLRPQLSSISKSY